MPRLSVIMPTYNHAAFVRAAIESVLQQSFRDFELVVTDDGSCDGTAEIVRGVTDPRLRFHAWTENRGACVAVNDTLGRARGEYVALLNSDDCFLPGKLERQVAFLDSHPEIGAVFGRPLFIDERGKPFHNTRHAFTRLFVAGNRSRAEWLRYFFHEGNGLCHPTIMVRKACYDKVGSFDPLLMQLPDLDMWVRLCREFEIHILPEPVTAFRILDGERNTSAPSTARLARTAWETATVLGHYAAMPDADLRTIFPEPGPPRLNLALAAIRVGRPGYVPFGLALLRDLMRAGEHVFPVAEYFKLVGAHDPFGAEYVRREYQYLRGSRMLVSLRKLARWWRSRNAGPGA